MDHDDENSLSQAQGRQYAALRSDLSAALAAFDRAQDWADLIHDLQRVNRVLSKYASINSVPEKHLLAKRLAQCLTSFLPSGVHLKALETYHMVFNRIGSERLAQDLPLYAGGLFPLLSHCSTSLKAPLLSLYETHFLPLGKALRPVLDGLILAILPGLDDEGSEFFSRARTLLDNVSQSIQHVPLFSRSLWNALLLSPPMRTSAAQYLRSTLAAGNIDLRPSMITDMPLVAYAINAALADDDALTQRSVLDLLLDELALHSAFFQSTHPDHRDAAVAVVGGVFGTLLRRDMSLTKRVHAWLLGGNESHVGMAFCKKYSNDLVLAAIDAEIASCLEIDSTTSVKTVTRPCKIAAALMDREELSNSLGHSVALRILKYGRLAIELDQRHERDIRASISSLLHDLGSARLFAELERMLVREDERTNTDFELLSFALSIFPTKDDIVRKKHLPALLRVAVQSLNAVSTDTLTLDRAVTFCSKAVMAMDLSRYRDIDESLSSSIKEIVASFASFFVAWLAHVVESSPVEVRRSYDDVNVSEEYSAEIRMASMCESRKESVSLAKGACIFFVSVVSSGVGGKDSTCSSLQATAKCASAADVRISLAGAKAFADVAAYANRDSLMVGDSEEQVFGVIRRCWRQMHPSLRTATPQGAQTFLALQHRFPDEVKIVVADGILSSVLSRRLRNLERFACLWRLAVEHRLRPLPEDNGLFLMLDALTDEHWGPKMLARSWLSDALDVDPSSVLDAPLRLLLTPESRSAGYNHEFVAVYDAPRALYGFQVLRSVLESCPAMMGSSNEHGVISSPHPQLSRKDPSIGRAGVRALASSAPSPRTTQALARVFAIEDNTNEEVPDRPDHPTGEGPVQLSHLLPANNYIVTIALVCLGYLRGTVPEKYCSDNNVNGVRESDDVESIATSLDSADDAVDLEWTLAGLGGKSLGELHAGVSAAAAECLAALLSTIPVPSQMSSVVANLFAEPTLKLINGKGTTPDPVLQLHFLNAMSFLVTADGPCYLSSILGKQTFSKSIALRGRTSLSDASSHTLTAKHIERNQKGIQVSAAEALDLFVPWLLEGVSSTYRSSASDHDSGSQEVMGVRRRWIQLIDTVLRHVGVSLPTVAEGLLLILCELLKQQNKRDAEGTISGDSEFSRVDETLVLLEGLAVVTSNVLWSFEHALSNGDLKDVQGQAIENRTDLGTLSTTLGQNASGTHPRSESLNSLNSELTGLAGSPENETGHGSLPVINDRSNSVSNATNAMINALNPLRMINDFVKDVLTGGGPNGAYRLLDPRRCAARLLVITLPSIVLQAAHVWGPTSEVHLVESENSADRSSIDGVEPPRLSTELPRERRQAQRSSVLSILEPLFELRPVDVIAAAIGIFCSEQDEYGTMPPKLEGDAPSKTICHMLHAMDFATPEVVVTCVKLIFEKAAKWDAKSPDAVEGRGQASLRKETETFANSIVSQGFDTLDDKSQAFGRMAPINNTSPLPGGVTTSEQAQPLFSSVNGTAAGHHDLFHNGDFFAIYAPGVVQSACMNFLDNFLATCTDGDDTQGAWPLLLALLRDALSNAQRKATIPAVVRLLGTYVVKNPSPFPERRYRREIMVTAASAITACASLASVQVDISNQEQMNIPDFKKMLSIISLRALAKTLSPLIDSTFLDDKQQLTNSATAALSPAISTLKKAASRAAAIHTANSLKRNPGVEADVLSAKQKSETSLDIMACKAAADIVLNITYRDWGFRLARRDLVTHMDDPNFFCGKGDGVLQQISAIVKEIVASGGASAFLSSIGTTASNGAPGIPSLFVGRDTETVQRGRSVRRIAYCVFVSEPEHYTAQLPFILEKVRDALRITDSALVGECLFCLRSLLLRTGAPSISAFRATALSELFRIISNPSHDLNATIAALKFLDLITVLSPPDFGYERCFFFNDGSRQTDDPSEKLFKPLVPHMMSLWSTEKRSDDEIFAPPLRLERGKTVLPGNPPFGFGTDFIGRYATGLVVRNGMPKMQASRGDMDVLCKEFELEFLE